MVARYTRVVSNLPTPRVNSSMNLSQVLVAIGDLLQPKFDRDGSEVTDLETNTRAGAVWPNAVDDWLMALQGSIDSLKESVEGLEAGGTLVKDTRETGQTTTGSVSSSSSLDFTIPMAGSTRWVVQWLRVVRNSEESSATSTVFLYADSDRTKLVYQAALQAGDPLADVYDYTDGTPFACFSNDGTGLEDSTLYATIVNDGDGASTYTVRMFAVGYPTV